MAEQRHLQNAPITEAVIDFRVMTGAGVTAATLETAIGRADFGYHRIGPIYDGEVGLSSPPFPMLGTRLQSSDGKYIVQVTVRGFTLSRLAPYETWDALQREARRLWLMYVAAAQPRAITRVALRFINDLTLPLRSDEDFGKFLTTPLEIKDPAFAAVSGFLLRYEAQDKLSEATIVCTQLFRPSAMERASVVIDIDIFRDANFEVDGESAWRYLSELRDVKNRVFFNLITEDFVRLFQ